MKTASPTANSSNPGADGLDRGERLHTGAQLRKREHLVEVRAGIIAGMQYRRFGADTHQAESGANLNLAVPRRPRFERIEAHLATGGKDNSLRHRIPTVPLTGLRRFLAGAPPLGARNAAQKFIARGIVLREHLRQHRARRIIRRPAQLLAVRARNLDQKFRHDAGIQRIGEAGVNLMQVVLDQRAVRRVRRIIRG